MAAKKIADVVCALPYGNEGKKKYRTVGALLQLDKNDPTKGPGFVIMLDAIFNPAGAIIQDGSIALSCYHPSQPGVPEKSRAKPHSGFDDMDDDIPF